MSATELRGEQWHHPMHGLARLAGATEPQPETRIADAIALLGPRGALGGWALAYRQGVRVLDGEDRQRRQRPVLLFSGPGSQLRRRPGIEPSRAVLPEDEVTDSAGVTVVSLARAAVDEMCRVCDLTEAVVVVDALVSRVRTGPRTTRAEIAALVSRHARLRGLGVAEQALALADDRVASPPETRLRIRAHRLGLRSWWANWPVFDRSGRLLGVVDLLDKEAGLVLEYDGAGHRDPDRHDRDNVREEDLEARNLVVARFGARDTSRRATADARILAAHARASRRDRGRDGWTATPPPWWWGSEVAHRWGFGSRPPV